MMRELGLGSVVKKSVDFYLLESSRKETYLALYTGISYQDSLTISY
jgi:hypothetical protein